MGDDVRRQERRGRWRAGALLPAINGMLLGVAGVYTATASIPVTVLATAGAVTVAGLVLRGRR